MAYGAWQAGVSSVEGDWAYFAHASCLPISLASAREILSQTLFPARLRVQGSLCPLIRVKKVVTSVCDCLWSEGSIAIHDKGNELPAGVEVYGASIPILFILFLLDQPIGVSFCIS